MRLRTLIAISFVLSSSNAALAAETCGVRAATFSDGYEAGAQVPFEPPADSAALALSVDAGIDGSTTASPRIRISGTYAGPPNTGIAVDGINAARTLGRWSANVPLAIGLNTIDVKAAVLAGTTLSRSIRITRGTTAEPVTVDVVAQRFAPSRARIVVDSATSVVVTRVRADFDADGQVDADVSGASAVASFQYQRPGAYLAVIDVDAVRNGTPLTRRVSVPVVIEHVAETRFAMCGAFGWMRSRLAARDVEGALLALAPRLRTDFRAFWKSVSAELPTLAAGLGTIADGTIGSDGSAELLISQPDPLQPARYLAFRIAFDRDVDGVWRISGM